jgi:transposase-like protein
MLSEHRDMAAAQAFFRSAKAATGMTPDRVTTDGHRDLDRFTAPGMEPVADDHLARPIVSIMKLPRPRPARS